MSDIDARDLRDAFGRFATGVTLITASSPRGPIGITVNSFASVSLEPAMLSFCLANDGGRTAAFLAARHYAVHVLDAGQAHACRAFVESINVFDRFTHTVNAQGVPILHDPLAVFECAQHAQYPGGDHTIVLASVQNYHWREGDALGFFAGRLTAINAAA